VQEVSLISRGGFEESQEWSIIQSEIRSAIDLIVYPTGTSCRFPFFKLTIS
jgi:hypothetical protein